MRRNFGRELNGSSPASPVITYDGAQRYDGDGTKLLAKEQEQAPVVGLMAYDLALRDAEARFDETRRLTAHNAQLREALDDARTRHEDELAAASEREAELSAQLSMLRHTATESNARELCELGARAQVAEWRSRQAQRRGAGAPARHPREKHTKNH